MPPPTVTNQQQYPYLVSATAVSGAATVRRLRSCEDPKADIQGALAAFRTAVHSCFNLVASLTESQRWRPPFKVVVISTASRLIRLASSASYTGAGRCLLTFVSRSRTNSGCINAKSSGTSRQITRLPARAALKRRCSLLRCAFFITKIRSAHSTNSAVSGFSASWLVPAESTSRFSRRENTCSAVGLRSLFWLQTNRMVRTRALNLAPICHARRVGMARN